MKIHFVLSIHSIQFQRLLLYCCEKMLSQQQSADCLDFQRWFDNDHWMQVRNSLKNSLRCSWKVCLQRFSSLQALNQFTCNIYHALLLESTTQRSADTNTSDSQTSDTAARVRRTLTQHNSFFFWIKKVKSSTCTKIKIIWQFSNTLKSTPNNFTYLNSQMTAC